MIENFSFNAANFSDYELLDSGNGRKLERIKDILVDRPSPQSIWRPCLSKDEWSKATSICTRTDDGGGQWKHRSKDPGEPVLKWTAPDGNDLSFKLKFTPFGHCGIFFEQASVWKMIHEFVSTQRKALNRRPKFLNLFAYTGAASICAASAGAEVFHVDSAKGVVNWTRQNAQLNKIPEDQLRTVCEDVISFLKHSIRKGHMYDGILADPPSWGHGAKKEVWVFEKQIQELIELCLSVLQKEKSFFILTSHTHGVQQEALVNLLTSMQVRKMHPSHKVISKELGVLHKNDSRILPAGILALKTDL